MVLLQEHERFQQGCWLALVKIVAARFEQLAARSKARVDRVELAILCRRDERREILKKNRVQLSDGFRSAVVLLHQLLAREPIRPVLQTHLRRERRLMIEQQAIL